MKKIFAITFIAALAFTACSNDDEGDISTQKEVKIITSITGNAPATRATFNPDGSGNFVTNDVFALSAWSPTLGIGYMYGYQVGQTTLYWDEISPDGNPVEVNAWYPNYTSTQSYKVANAATEAVKDLLMAPPVTVSPGNPVNLQFKHVMHKLVINLSSNHYDATQLDAATISLKNLKSDAMVDFENGTVDETAASGTDAYPLKRGSSVSFIVAPQNLPVADTDMIEILVDGKTFTYKIPSGLTVLESGKKLSLTLTLKEDGSVTGTVGENFNSGGGHDGWN